MNQALQIGPLSLPYSVLLTLVAIALGGFVARRLARAAGIETEPTLTHMLLVGLVAARLAFVWQWREQYFDLPLSILDIRDGGWEPTAGVIAALLFDFINGVSDSANAIATIVSTRVLTPFKALMLAAVLNMVGALSGTAIAKTITKGIIRTDLGFLTPDAVVLIVLCAMLAACLWAATALAYSCLLTAFASTRVW